MAGTQAADFSASDNSEDYKSDAYDPTMEVTPSQVRRANPGVPVEELFGTRSKSDLDRMVERIPSIAGQSAEALREKRAADEAARAKFGNYQEEDRARMVAAQNAMGVEAQKLQPWDADAAREKFKTNPIESFGSLGSVFAMVASAFTHAPMTNALNASAEAMHAIKDGNDEQFKRAFDAFKENNDLVVKRHAMMSTQYNAAATLMDKDMAAGRDALQYNAAKFGDQRLLTLLQNGYDKEALDYISSFTKMTKDQYELKDYLTEHAYKQQTFEQGVEQIRKEFGNDPAQFAPRVLAWYRHTFDKKETKPEDAAFGLWLSSPEGLKASPTEVMAKAHEFGRQARQNMDAAQAETYKNIYDENIAKKMSPAAASEDALNRSAKAASKMGRAGSVQQDRSKRADSVINDLETSLGMEVPPGLANMIHTSFEAGGVGAFQRQAQLEAAIEHFKLRKLTGEDVSPEALSNFITKAVETKSTLTPNVVDVGARLLIKGSPAYTVGLGRNAQGVADLAAIRSRATEILMDPNEGGLTADEAAQHLNLANMQMKALQSGALNLARRESTVFSASNLALSTANRVLEASEKIPRTRFKDVNEALMNIKGRTGGEDVVQLDIAMETFAKEYARASVGGTNQLSDTAQKIARNMLQRAWSKGQVRAAMDQMVKELGDMRRSASESLELWGQGTPLFGGKKPDAPTVNVPGRPSAPVTVPGLGTGSWVPSASNPNISVWKPAGAPAQPAPRAQPPAPGIPGQAPLQP